MDENILNDLKQFIAGTVSQQTAEIRQDFTRLEWRFDGLEQRFDGLEKRFDGLEKRFDGLEHKVDDLTVFVTEAIDTANETSGEQLKDHERRISALEHAGQS